MSLKPRGVRSADFSTMATRLLLSTMSLVLIARVATGLMDITAFEYIRKFSDPLHLGECPVREIPVDERGIERLRCSRIKQGSVKSLSRPLHSTRNVRISTPNDIIAYLGLCGGEAASFLGILNNGDCVAIEIASRLNFNEKTMINAYVEYYRKGLKILENNTLQRRDIEDKDDGSYYLKNISYGTLEIIIVQFRYRLRKDTLRAKELKDPDSLMSVYMETVRKEVGKPSKLLVIRLSTAEKGKYETKQFKSGQYALALRHVQIMEAEIKHLRDEIHDDKRKPHLRYSLYPFEAKNIPKGRLAPRVSDEMWEKTSVLEVTLTQAVSIGKKSHRRCRKVRTTLCKRVRELLRTLKKTQRKIHRSRSRWMNLTLEQKRDIASTKVEKYARAMKNQTKAVRKWWKMEKLRRLKNKNNIKNQTGVKGPNRMLRKNRRFGG